MLLAAAITRDDDAYHYYATCHAVCLFMPFAPRAEAGHDALRAQRVRARQICGAAALRSALFAGAAVLRER